MNASLEGYLQDTWNGSYVLLLPTLIEGENASVELTDRVEVPRANVLFWERL